MTWLRNLAGRQHLLVALGAVWLIATRPWISLRRLVPADAGLFDRAHVAVGLVMAALALSFAVHTLTGGGWRQLFPWLAGDLRGIAADLRGLARGRVPRAGGSGLICTLNGLVLVAFAATAWTGLGWWLADGGPGALSWRAWHAGVANVFVVLLGLHALAALAQIAEFLRN